MTLKNKPGSHIRGWFPQEPNLNIIQSMEDNAKFDTWALFPFLAPGALMIFASLISALFGLTLVSAYLPDALVGAENIYYSGLYVGILSVGAFILGVFSGCLLLAKKHLTTAVIAIAAIFSFGVGTIVIPSTFGSLWQSGLFVASPMIASSVLSLILVGINTNKLRGCNTTIEAMLIVQSESTISRKPIVTGFTAAGCGFLLIGALMNVTMRVFPEITIVCLFIMGISLLIVAYLERRTYKH